MASHVIADPFHRMKYMERHGSGLRKIVRETEKPPGYTAAYNPKIFSTATDFRVILKNVNYQLSQKNLVNDQVSEQDKSPDIPHTVLNLCIHLIAHGSEGAQITHAHSIMGTANDTKTCFGCFYIILCPFSIHSATTPSFDLRQKSFNPHTIPYMPVSQMQSFPDKDYNIVCKPS